MFAPRYFARHYFAGRYWPPVGDGGGVVEPPQPAAPERRATGGRRRPDWERELLDRLLRLKAERAALGRLRPETRTEEILGADELESLQRAEREVARYRRLAAQARDAAMSARAEREMRATTALIAAEAAVAAAEVAIAWRREDEDDVELLLLA
jgi:hypothetical protein